MNLSLLRRVARLEALGGTGLRLFVLTPEMDREHAATVLADAKAYGSMGCRALVLNVKGLPRARETQS